MDSFALFKELETIERKGNIHRAVQERLRELGERLGYNSVIEYRAGRHEGRQDIIDVVWLRGSKVASAFEVRVKNRNLHLITTRKDRRKLERLNAEEKFIVNVSEAGRPYVHKL